MDEERLELEVERNTLKTDLKVTQEKTDGLKRDGDVDRKKIEDLLRSVFLSVSCVAELSV